MKLFIINTYDRPCEELIVEHNEEDDLFYYVHQARFKSWEDKGLGGSKPTPLGDFGIDYSLVDGNIVGELNRVSVAEYTDGRVRPWQGNSKFNFKKAQ